MLFGCILIAIASSFSELYIYERTLHLKAPAAVLVDFFSDVRNLDRETPAFFRLFLTQGEVGVPLFVGQQFHYQFRVFGIPFPWTTEITEVEEESFVDVQRRGPFASFEHRHSFFSINDGTLMVDRLVYRLPFGPLNGFANALVVRPLLDGIFDFRAMRAGERFGLLENR